MKKKVEELLKKAKTATKNKKADFQNLVYCEFENKNITSYDVSYLIDAYEYFLNVYTCLPIRRTSWTKGYTQKYEDGKKPSRYHCLPAYRTAWAQGYIRKDEDGKIELYAGRLGYGYIEHIRSEKSSRYHLICYHIIAY